MRSKFTWIIAFFMALTFNLSYAQEKTVSGTVSDESGPLPGATIVVKGTQRSAQTDLDGKFAIAASQGQVLEFSYLGFKTQSVTVGAANTYNVILREDVTEIKDVQLDVYRRTPVSKAPYAVAAIGSEAIEDRANANVLQSLQGQFAGFNIGTGSGQPGADSTLIIRGVGSINGNVEPLIIVDGIPVDEDNFRNINPNDIASVAVLKDAAATAIYGNRGAQGVIVVYTKKAGYGQKLDFRYTSQFGYNELQPLNMHLMNSREILMLQKQYGEGLGSELTDAEIDARARQANTYWADVFFRKGITKSHDLAITAGSANLSNFTSLNYFEQEGIFMNSGLKRFSLRNNLSGKSEDDKFNYTLSVNASFSRSSDISGAGTNAIYFAPFRAAMQGLPYLSPYDANGNLTLDNGFELGDTSVLTPQNVPYVLMNSVRMNTERTDQFRLLTSFNARYEFIKNVTAGIQLGADYAQNQSIDILHPNSLLGPFQTDARAAFGGYQTQATSRDFRFNSVTSLNYNNTFAEKHGVDFTVYVEYNKQHYDSFGYVAYGLDPRLVGTGAAFIDPITEEEIGGSLVNPYIGSASSGKASEGLFSYFANLEYSYGERFGFAGTIRRDASFRFIKDNQWGTFWSVAGSWNIENEAFLQDTFVNQLRLRASYGTNGNQRILNTAYSALNLTRSLYGNTSGYNNVPGTVAAQLGYEDLRWETTAQTNIGLDFAFWKNKLSGSVEVYRKLTTDLFDSAPLSPVVGGVSQNANVGSMENKGFEVTLKYYLLNNTDWQISLNANTSYNKNKIRDLDPSFNGISTAGGSSALVEGHPLGSYYVQRYAGVNPATGNALFYTADGQLTETMSDNDRVLIGKQLYPIWQGGFGTNISYKGFEFSTQWAYVADLYRNNLDYADLEDTSAIIDDGSNRVVSVFTAWQNPGDITSVPRVGHGIGSVTYINNTDRYIEDASYLRMRQVLLGYSFNKETLKDTPLSGLRFFIQGENLLTFSSYRGWDAEAGFRSTDRGNYPTAKIYTIGAVVNF